MALIRFYLRKFYNNMADVLKDSPPTKQYQKVMDVYENFTGMKEVKSTQQNVLTAEQAFVDSAKLRRNIQNDLHRVQKDLKQIRRKLESMSRSDESYLDLITNEHKMIKNELELLNSLRSQEEVERELFSSYSQRVREAHVFERLRQEKLKYVSFFGPVIGAILGMSVNHFRKRGEYMNTYAIHQIIETNERHIKSLGEEIDRKMENLRSRLESVNDEVPKVPYPTELEPRNLEIIENNLQSIRNYALVSLSFSFLALIVYLSRTTAS
ncbi:mitochondrial potassium channel-like [Brevipalpus obovatus]|uniref:mitochondrial potassium channel-like n=1 Tax=Brevipalpus obovatus TaxID=246614 RepID=UPI003D9EA8E9